MSNPFDLASRIPDYPKKPDGTSITPEEIQKKAQELLDQKKAEQEKKASQERKEALSDPNNPEYWKYKLEDDTALYTELKGVLTNAIKKGDIMMMLVAYQATQVAKMELDIDQMQSDLEQLQKDQEYINGLNVDVQDFAEDAQNYMTKNGKSDVKDTGYADISAVMVMDTASLQKNIDDMDAELNKGLTVKFTKDGEDQEINLWEKTKGLSSEEAAKKIQELTGGMAPMFLIKYKGYLDSGVIDQYNSYKAKLASAVDNPVDIGKLKTIGPENGYTMEQLEALYKDEKGAYGGLTNALNNIAKSIDNQIQNLTTRLNQLTSQLNAMTDVLSAVLKTLTSELETALRNI